MMFLYCEDNNRIVQHEHGNLIIPPNVVWIDLFNPTREEEKEAEKFLGIELPTREEMGEIEISNRLYQEDGAQFMTATLLAKVDTQDPETHAITFVIAGKVLVTIRYVDPISFQLYSAQIHRLEPEAHEGSTMLLGLLDSVVNRLADILERIGRDIDGITKSIFRRPELGQKGENANLQDVLLRIGRCGDLVSKVHESLVTLGRLAVFASHNKRMCLEVNDARLTAIRRDISGLNDHTTYLTGKVNFLLDATLGMVSIQQNSVFRVLSTASLIFMPPTLVAGIYGMNFKFMPELEWHWGYPTAIALMLFAAILPLAYLKQRKYL